MSFCDCAMANPPHASDHPTGDTISDQILAAYRVLATRPGGPVRLERLRNHLDAGRDEIDRALIEMDDRREIHLEPDPDRLGLPAEAREAAVELAGRPMHLLRVSAR